jgi:hypothetical protein
MRNLKSKIEGIISDFESAISDMESAKSDLEYIKESRFPDIPNAENNEITLGDVIKWFESPFVSDYDKNIVLDKFKK